ncbi:hypothetical protein E4U42_001181 [Claviceps africana]|uniref:FPD1 n=1 Tax=Claviceps africana TaxID=83212 RepID=A0A8K0J4N5_9HYPO|nr:hypothetical protein E4U42_001181 [Claviceps africana]
MLPTTIRSPPSLEDYVPLAQYQSQTPESFSGGKPVLHFHLEEAGASIPQSQCGTLAIFPADSPVAASSEASTNGDAEQAVKQTVDVFVNSEHFTIFCPKTESGVSIPYPSISIHAVKQVPAHDGGASATSVWMQLDFADGGVDDDDFSTVELTISPADAADAQRLYDAVATCSNLHPDPADDDDGDQEEDDYDRIVFESNAAEGEAVEGFTGVLRGATDGGLPPPLPGSGGWITADNVHEYFDDEGNWIGRDDEAPGPGQDEELGDGAGRTRLREEVDGEERNGGDDSESKRLRVE